MKLLLIIMTFFGFLFGVSTASAEAEIHACYNSSGVLVITEVPEDCNQNATSISWNILGPVGPAGPEGPEGPEGPAGGGQSLDVQHVTSIVTFSAPIMSKTIDCTQSPGGIGYVAVSGTFDTLPNTVKVLESDKGANPSEWDFLLERSGDENNLTVGAVCMKLI